MRLAVTISKGKTRKPPRKPAPGKTWVRSADARFGFSNWRIASVDLSIFSNQSRPYRQGVPANLHLALEPILGKSFIGSADTPRTTSKGILQELSFDFRRLRLDQGVGLFRLARQ